MSNSKLFQSSKGFLIRSICIRFAFIFWLILVSCSENICSLAEIGLSLGQTAWRCHRFVKVSRQMSFWRTNFVPVKFFLFRIHIACNADTILFGEFRNFGKCFFGRNVFGIGFSWGNCLIFQRILFLVILLERVFGMNRGSKDWNVIFIIGDKPACTVGDFSNFLTEHFIYKVNL